MNPRKISIWWLAAGLSLLVLAIVSLVSNRGASEGQDSPAISKPAPRIDLVRLSDQPNLDRVDAVAVGSVTLIHFWGTWCGPCKMEYPQLSAMASRLRASPRFRFLSVSCEGGPNETFEGLWEATNDYFQSEGIDGDAFADPQGITRRSVAERLERNAMFYPTTLVIGVEGKIAGVWEGYTPEAVSQMESLIRRLLQEAALTTTSNAL
jgi:thiol-disulfide isomerase/thioredoxin